MRPIACEIVSSELCATQVVENKVSGLSAKKILCALTSGDQRSPVGVHMANLHTKYHTHAHRML